MTVRIASSTPGAGGTPSGVAIANVTGLQSALNLLQASATAATDSELSAAVATLQAGIDGSATDADLTGAVNTINTSLAAKQDASSAATDTELAGAVATINTSLGAKQPLALEGTKAAMPVANTVPAKTVYFANDENGGTCYRSDGVTSTASPAGWTKVSPGVLETGGRELGYAEITSNFATSTQSAATDVTGLSITVTVASRPILVEFFTSQFFHSAASAAPSLRLLEDGAIVQVANSQLPTAGGGPPSHMRVRRAPSAGSHTYKVQVFQGASPVGTITVQGGTTAPAFIRATEG